MLICEAVEPNGKSCSACGCFKSMDEYRSHKTTKDRHSPKCKSCDNAYTATWRLNNAARNKVSQHNAYLKNKYGGLTEVRFQEMWEEQASKCASCGDPIRRGIGGHAVDHNHTTKKVRALLCLACNTTIGAHQEDTDRLRKLISYLEFHNAA